MNPGALQRRLVSLDAFRGLTIAAMILVNSPGNDEGYRILKHSPWHGWTLADLVFPSFLVMMGVSLAISLGRRLDRGETASAIHRQIYWRSAVIFGLGLITSAVLADQPVEPMRFVGVLQRIAVCYFFCSRIFLGTRPRGQAFIAAALLLGYWALLMLPLVPEYGAGDLSPQGNLASLFDRALMGRHLFAPSLYDPEGLLSTLPALATSLIGVLAGQRLRSPRRHSDKAAQLVGAGVLCLMAGQMWSFVFPINKNLWTSSFALFGAGAALTGLAVFYWLVEVADMRAWAHPLEVFGRNPLLSYFLSGFFYDLQEFIRAAVPGYERGNVKLWLTWRLFGGLSPADASLAYALSYIGLCWAVMWAFNRRKIFLKI